MKLYIIFSVIIFFLIQNKVFTQCNGIIYIVEGVDISISDMNAEQRLIFSQMKKSWYSRASAKLTKLGFTTERQINEPVKKYPYLKLEISGDVSSVIVSLVYFSKAGLGGTTYAVPKEGGGSISLLKLSITEQLLENLIQEWYDFNCKKNQNCDCKDEGYKYYVENWRFYQKYSNKCFPLLDDKEQKLLYAIKQSKISRRCNTGEDYYIINYPFFESFFDIIHKISRYKKFTKTQKEDCLNKIDTAILGCGDEKVFKELKTDKTILSDIIKKCIKNK